MNLFLKRLFLCLYFCSLFSLPLTAFAESGDEFYFEDFSATDEGLLPEGWKGGEVMAVEKIDGISVLKSFAPGDIDIQTGDINFPENFTLEMSLISQGSYNMWAGVRVSLGELSVAIGNIYKGRRANFLYVTRGSGQGTYQPVEIQAQKTDNGTFASYRLTIEKKGSVCKVYVNNDRIFLGRFKGINPTKIRFQTAGMQIPGEGHLPFRIVKIVGTEL